MSSTMMDIDVANLLIHVATYVYVYIYASIIAHNCMTYQQFGYYFVYSELRAFHII